MSDVFDLMLYGFESMMDWMSKIEYNGISVLHVCFVALFLSLIWGFILSPLFGNRGGSLSIGASDYRAARGRHERLERQKKKSK